MFSCDVGWIYLPCQGLTTLWAVRVNDGLELEVTDPQENQGDIEQKDGES